MNRKFSSAFVCTFILPFLLLWPAEITIASSGASISNGSFETGTFAGWIATDMATPFDPLAVLPAGAGTAFGNMVIPSDGTFACNNGFDGGGPDTISLAQDIGVIAPGDTLTFDYRLAWDLTFGGTLDRTFDVLLEPAGGGAAISVFPVFVAVNGTDSISLGDPNLDTGPLTMSIDLSPFAGIDARVNFVWTIPESFTGPGNAQLDNVRITTGPPPASITNGSFETGDFTGWIPTDMATPFDPLAVLPSGAGTAFGNMVIPSDGTFACNNGFDGDGPDLISLAQDVGVIATGDVLTFDFRAAWFNFGAFDRTIEVWVEPAGGGAPIGIFPILSAPAGTDSPTLFGDPNLDTGPRSGLVDLSPFAGLDARINFVWFIPESFTGAGNAQLDNVAITRFTPGASISNGSFETGDFTGWIPIDMAIPLDPLAVLPAGAPNSFAGIIIPSDGMFAASNGFDGGGPDTISLAQDIGIIACGDTLTFDYRIGWDIFGALDRSFDVILEPVGGGPPLAVFPIFTAPAGTTSIPLGDPNFDTGPLSASIDLTPFAGTNARINFVWSIPEFFTGPGNAQLDNVRIFNFNQVITNGSFETGGFAGWIPTDMAMPFEPLSVLPAGTPIFFGGLLIPSDGMFAANNGFDGCGPDVISLAQDIGVIADGDLLKFDYRCAWFNGGLLDRTFDLVLEPAGGGPPLAVFPVLTAAAGTDSLVLGDPNLDTGPLHKEIDLSCFAGIDARINFVWTIPECFTGPGNAQLDNVSLIRIFALGDVNRDGAVNLLDVDPFILLIASGTYQCEGDINGDGFVNLLDVQGFVDILAGP